ncbi:MAG: hypothetical protein MI746_08470 [Pseudomonadales bacterium]|nr:hypothetical protein [Pseudomonadales bacterium]
MALFSKSNELGSVSIFVNIPKDCEAQLRGEAVKDIERQIIKAFESHPAFKQELEGARISGVASTRGCLITTITIVAGSAVAAAGGYLTLKKVAAEIAKGLDIVSQKLRHNEKLALSAALYRTDLPASLSNKQIEAIEELESKLKSERNR